MAICSPTSVVLNTGFRSNAPRSDITISLYIPLSFPITLSAWCPALIYRTPKEVPCRHSRSGMFYGGRGAVRRHHAQSVIYACPCPLRGAQVGILDTHALWCTYTTYRARHETFSQISFASTLPTFLPADLRRPVLPQGHPRSPPDPTGLLTA